MEGTAGGCGAGPCVTIPYSRDNRERLDECNAVHVILTFCEHGMKISRNFVGVPYIKESRSEVAPPTPVCPPARARLRASCASVRLVERERRCYARLEEGRVRWGINGKGEVINTIDWTMRTTGV